MIWTVAQAIWPVLIASAGLAALLLLIAHELGPYGAWARSKRASENLRDVDERRAERDLYPTTGRTVVGTPRDWSESA